MRYRAKWLGHPSKVVRFRRAAWEVVASAAFLACEGARPVAPRATVQYTLVAPLCSSVIPVRFYIDSVQVGADTFRINVAGEHTSSSGFATSAGQHTLGAQALGNGWAYVWSDRAVSLASGAVFTDSLPLYCS